MANHRIISIRLRVLTRILAAHWFTTGLTSAVHYTERKNGCKGGMKINRLYGMRRIFYFLDLKKGSLSSPLFCTNGC